MHFDLASFFIGAGIAFLISFLAYRRRAELAALWQRIRAKLEQLKNQLTAGLETRYQKALKDHCEEWHIARGQASFEAIYVPQKFAPPAPKPTLSPIDPGTIKPVSISAALRSTKRLAVLGVLGSGRTMLLLHLARTYVSKQGAAELGTANYTPVLLHLAEVDWGRVTTSDPLSQVLEAATAHVPQLIAPNVAGMLKNRVRGGNAILLLDGFDELRSDERLLATQWLTILLDKYPENQIVVTTGLLGYGALINLGFAALQLADWEFTQVERFTENWLGVIGGGKQDRKILVPGLRQLFEASPRPVDLTLAVVDWRAFTRLPTSRIQAFDHWLERATQLDPNWKDFFTADKLSAALGNVAWAAMQEQRLYIGLDEIEKALQPLMPTIAESDAQAKAITSVGDIPRAVADRSGLFIPFGLDAYAFAHPQLSAYLAAYHAVHGDVDLAASWDLPEWNEVFEFYAALSDPSPLVLRALSLPDDLSRTRMSTAARWTGYAALDAVWRSKVMSELARGFLQPDLVPALRQRALVGLLATHDKGLPFLLKRGMTHTDVTVRRLSVRGLGTLGREPDLPVFIGALADPQPEIHYEALQAIGNLARNGSHPATQALIKILLEQDDDSRRLAAETLAECGEEGYQILHEGVIEDDIKVRRAAAYGLALIDQVWAHELLQKLEREEKQWYVRNAVLDALSIWQTRAAGAAKDPTVDLTPIVVDKQGWLVEWAAKQGVGIGVGRQATEAMLKAMAEGQPPVRLAAIHTIQQLGDIDYHDQLRALLYDPDREVREAAFEALETIGQRTGLSLPR